MTALAEPTERPLPRDSAATSRLLAFFSTRRGEIVLVAGLVLLGLALRYPNLWLEPPMTDEWRGTFRSLDVAQFKKFILADFSTYIGALWNYLTVVAYWILGPDFRTPRVLAWLFGALTVVPAYLLGREMGGQRAGLFSGLLMTTSPVHVIANSHIAWSHSSTPFFSTFACWLLVGAVNRSSGRWLALSGLLWGMAFQTHPVTFLMVPGAIAYLWLRGRRLLFSRWLFAGGALFVVGCLNLLIWMVIARGEFLYDVTGNQDRSSRGEASGITRYLKNVGNIGMQLARLPSGVVLDSNDVRETATNPLVWLYIVTLGGGAVVAARRGEPLALCMLVPTFLIFPPFQPGSWRPVPDGRYTMPLLPPLYASLSAMAARASRGVAAGAGAAISRWGTLARKGAMPLVALLVLIPLGTIYVYYLGRADSRARYSRVWDTMLDIQHLVPVGTHIVIAEDVKDLMPERAVRRRVPFMLEASGYPTAYEAIDAQNLATELADRSAVYLLPCPAYQQARAQLRAVPLAGGEPDQCDLMRAARLG